MKSTKLIDTLNSLGLSEHESRVYLASLSLGPASVLKIAKTAEVKRTTVYDVIESLMQLGLMRTDIDGFKQLYAAENPEKLEIMLSAKREELASALPEFMALYNLKGGESFIRYYEGLESVKNIYTQITRECKPQDELLILCDQESWFKQDPEFFQKYLLCRAQMGATARKLLTPSPDIQEHNWGTETYKEEIRILPEDTKLITNLVITPRKVLIHQLIPPILAIEIENPSVVQMNKAMFEIMWRSVK